MPLFPLKKNQNINKGELSSNIIQQNVNSAFTSIDNIILQLSAIKASSQLTRNIKMSKKSEIKFLKLKFLQLVISPGQRVCVWQFLPKDEEMKMRYRH